jgi:hypothetical protein
MILEVVRAIVIGIVLLCGCRDPDVQHVKAVRDEVCACKTVSCGEEAVKKLPTHNIKASHRQQSLANEMLTCMSKLYLKDRPTTDPDTGSADPPKP